LGAGDRVPADRDLVEALGRAGGSHGAAGAEVLAGPVVSTDLFYDARDRERGWAAAGALAVEMECAAMFALAARRRVSAAALLLVTDLLVPARRRIETARLHDGELHLGSVAARALAAVAGDDQVSSSPSQ
jgi:purine-nucleoside phosphorylase